MALNTIKGEKFRFLDNGYNIFYRDIHESFDFLKNPPKIPFILVSHNGDGSITNNPTRIDKFNSNDVDFKNINLPHNLIKWYSQNVDVVHEKVISIPIGLENSQWFPEIQKEQKILDISKKQPIYKNLLYINHNISTNPKERSSPYEYFKNKSWTTLVHGYNGRNFDQYLNDIHSHKFVLCPEGNGIDTHRTWETLYIGSIPIEKRNKNNIFYIDLPICFVDKWEDISEDFLNFEYDRIKNSTWNLKKLDLDYWKNLINSEI